MPGTSTNVVNEAVWVLKGADMDNLTALGYTAKGSDVTLNINENIVDQLVAQMGETPIDGYFNGTTAEITVDFAELVNWNLWPEILVNGELQYNDETPPDNRYASNRIADTTFVGRKCSSVWEYLVLRPIELYTDPTTETVRDWVFPRVVAVNTDSITFGIESPQVAPVTFRAYGDDTATDGANVFYRGKFVDAATWTAL